MVEVATVSTALAAGGSCTAPHLRFSTRLQDRDVPSPAGSFMRVQRTVCQLVEPYGPLRNRQIGWSFHSGCCEDLRGISTGWAPPRLTRAVYCA
jgi:hypothetical protein